jgi:hypothetical protein
LNFKLKFLIDDIFELSKSLSDDKSENILFQRSASGKGPDLRFSCLDSPDQPDLDKLNVIASESQNVFDEDHLLNSESNEHRLNYPLSDLVNLLGTDLDFYKFFYLSEEKSVKNFIIIRSY